jgi:hypothetical protein
VDGILIEKYLPRSLGQGLILQFLPFYFIFSSNCPKSGAIYRNQEITEALKNGSTENGIKTKRIDW